MKTVYVDLTNVNSIKKFANILSRYEGDFDLVQGRYRIDGKSIVGIFSLDLSKPIQLEIENENPELDIELMPFLADQNNVRW